MDLRLFHSSENLDHDYTRFDRFNSWTRRQPCRLLEWTGWYASSVPLRLLGHYRLYQIHKKSLRRRPSDPPAVQGYILQYRNFHGVKFYLARFFSHFPAMWGYPDLEVEVLAINRMLIYDKVAVLQEFLINADIDFESAFRRALQQIRSPAFLEPGSTEAALVKEVVSGKEKGVFSKKQVLILFDMLAQLGKLEGIDLSKPNKLDAIAQFFQALTGKGKETWLETLKDYRNKDLYEFHTSGERNQLLSTLTNLSEITRAAGLRSVSNLVDKKMRDIEMKR